MSQADLLVAAEGPLCANCSAEFARPRPAFCPACGQESTTALPTVASFLQHLGGAYLSTEGALWRTLKLLFTRPGELTVQYLAGRRKHYVLPLRLYLTISLVLLVLMRLFTQVEVVEGLNRPEVLAAERAALPTMTLSVGPVQLGVRAGAFVCLGLPQALCHLVQKRAAPDARTFLSRARLANERLVSNLGAVMFVLLPLFALCLKVVNRNARLGYTGHLVFALHLHAFWFLALIFMLLRWPPAVWIGLTAMVVYTLMAGRRVYGGSGWTRLWRGLALSLMYAALLMLTVPVAWLLALIA